MNKNNQPTNLPEAEALERAKQAAQPVTEFAANSDPKAVVNEETVNG